MVHTLDIHLHGPSLNIVKQCGPALSDVLQSKFGCVAIINGVDFESDLPVAQQRLPKVDPEKRFAVTLPAGVKVSVWKADLSDFQVDAVVNTANNGLKHYGGLALALSCAGGPQIQKDSDDYINQKGYLKTGQAIVSDAGLLPCKKIIHVVGPCLPYQSSTSDVSQAEPLLKTAVKSILSRVEENHLKTVAIPAISSGLFNFPLPLCANTIVSTVKRYYETPSFQRHLPEEILLVNNDEPSVKAMERACRQILPSQKPMTYSQATSAKTSPPTLQIGNVLLTLKLGKIEEQQTDVIVNTTSPSLDLNIGQISKALLDKAGYGMQQEVKSASLQGKIIITKGYNLQCKEVYHTFCPDKEKKAAEQIIFHLALDCLWMAMSRQLKSIAFPAIGTGGLGFSKIKVAQMMSAAVAEFAQKSKHMIEVHFVIFPSDKNTYKAFEEQMECLRRKALHPDFTQAFEQMEHFHDHIPPTPKISLSSLSDETVCESQQWLSSLLKSCGNVTIRNNFIQHFGVREYQQLSHLTKKGISIEESFEKGHAVITVSGDAHEDVAVAGLQVEAMLCNIQKEFVRKEECAMLPKSTVSFERNTVSCINLIDRWPDFKKARLEILKLEKVLNPTLTEMFELKKKQLQCSKSRKMFQRIPAQFCEMVLHIGFHAEFAPPADPAYGEGIYFADTVRKAMDVWREKNEKFLYFVEAEVVTGNSTPGKPGLIHPPAIGTDPLIMYDSLSGGPDIAVIFSGYQALPKYIITCKA